MEGLNKYHDNWLLSDKLKSNVIVIDCEEEFEQDELKQTLMIGQIKSHIEQFFSHSQNKKMEIEYEFDLKSDSKSNSNSN